MTIKGKRLSIRVAAVVVTFTVAAVTGSAAVHGGVDRRCRHDEIGGSTEDSDRGRQEGRAR